MSKRYICALFFVNVSGCLGLNLMRIKTRIVYCKDVDRVTDYPDTSFDFLGYTFRPRLAKNKFGKIFLNFLPAISDKAIKGIKAEVKSWRLQLKVTKSLNDLAGMFNSQIQGWISYYGHYYKSELIYTLRYVNQCLIKWVRRKNIRNINTEGVLNIGWEE